MAFFSAGIAIYNSSRRDIANQQIANNTPPRTSRLFSRISSAPTAVDVPSSTNNSSTIVPVNQNSHIRIVPNIEDPNKCLVFSVIERDLEVGRIIKIGRFTDRSSIENHISFKSKVVSRSHCEIWLSDDGKIQLKDTKSSSGTFVNHTRLSAANTESKPVDICNGDLVQLGVDYQGGDEEIYRSVKMKFEVNRPNQQRPTSYDMIAFNNLRNLTSLSSTAGQLQQQPKSSLSCHEQNVELEDCCICLFTMAPNQAIFAAPCSHSYHFKCINPLLKSYPGFICPICRKYSDLDANVAVDAEEMIEKFGLRKSTTSTIDFSTIMDAGTTAAATTSNERLASSSSSVQPTNVNSCAIPEPPLSSTLVACTTSLSGILSFSTSSSIVPILENQGNK